MAKKTSKKEETKKVVKNKNTKKENVKAKDTKKVTKKKKEKRESIFKKATKFLKDVRSEMRKVRWPNRKEMIKYATATLVFILFFCAFFLLTDGIIWALKQVMR